MKLSFKDYFASTSLKADLVIHGKGSLQKISFKFCKTSPDPLKDILEQQFFSFPKKFNIVQTICFFKYS